MTTLIKAIKGLLRNESALKSASKAKYYTCLQDYVYHIKNGHIEGVHPSVIDTCPVCSKVYQEMYTSTEPVAAVDFHPRIDLNDISPQFWIAMWVLYHDSASYEESGLYDQYA